MSELHTVSCPTCHATFEVPWGVGLPTFHTCAPTKPSKLHPVAMVGAEVMWTKTFLKTIKTHPTDPIWRDRGIVKGHHPLGGETYLVIEWSTRPGKTQLAHPSAAAVWPTCMIE